MCCSSVADLGRQQAAGRCVHEAPASAVQLHHAASIDLQTVCHALKPGLPHKLTSFCGYKAGQGPKHEASACQLLGLTAM